MTTVWGKIHQEKIHQYFCKKCGKEFWAAEGSEASKDHLCGDCVGFEHKTIEDASKEPRGSEVPEQNLAVG